MFVEKPSATILPTDEAVDRRPRLGLEPQQLQLERQRAGARHRGVTPRPYAVEVVAGAVAEPRDLRLGGPPQPERAHQYVGLERLLAGELRHPAGREAAVELELPEPVLAVAEAVAEAEVDGRLRRDPRYAEAVAGDLDRRLQARRRAACPRSGEAAAPEPVPGRGQPPDRRQAAGQRDVWKPWREHRRAIFSDPRWRRDGRAVGPARLASAVRHDRLRRPNTRSFRLGCCCSRCWTTSTPCRCHDVPGELAAAERVRRTRRRSPCRARPG